MNKYVVEFFEKHPKENEVHVVDTSVLFLTKEYATTYAKGNAEAVSSFTREDFETFKKEQEATNNTGASGTTGQQSNDTKTTGGTETAGNSSPSDNKSKETDQNTNPGNVSADAKDDKSAANGKSK